MKLKQHHHNDAESGEYIKNEIDLKLDRINELWNQLERKLLKDQPPRRISCVYDPKWTGEEQDPEELNVEEHRYLGIQRHGGKWRVCYAITWDHREEETLPWKPVVECDVETRMDATRGIDQLKSHVRNTGTDFIPALNKAISGLEDAINNDEEE